MTILLEKRKAWRDLSAQATKITKAHGLTLTEYIILARLAEGDMIVTELAQYMDTTLAFVTTALNNLEAKGFVKRDRNGADQRKCVVSLPHVSAASEMIYGIEKKLEAL